MEGRWACLPFRQSHSGEGWRLWRRGQAEARAVGAGRSGMREYLDDGARRARRGTGWDGDGSLSLIYISTWVIWKWRVQVSVYDFLCGFPLYLCCRVAVLWVRKRLFFLRGVVRTSTDGVLGLQVWECAPGVWGGGGVGEGWRG